MLITALLMTAALGAASTPWDDPDSVVTTAPETTVVLDATEAPVAPPVGAGAQTTDPHGLSTDQQIAEWLAARSPADTTSGAADFWQDDRKPHGEISVGIGTEGYRDYAASVSLPIGERGRLDLSFRQTENGYPYGYGYGYGQGYEPYGRDPYYNDSTYAFPGAHKAGQAIEFESRIRRPDGPGAGRRDLRPGVMPTQ